LLSADIQLVSHIRAVSSFPTDNPVEDDKSMEVRELSADDDQRPVSQERMLENSTVVSVFQIPVEVAASVDTEFQTVLGSSVGEVLFLQHPLVGNSSATLLTGAELTVSGNVLTSGTNTVISNTDEQMFSDEDNSDTVGL